MIDKGEVMIYKVTETEIYDDDEAESHTYLSERIPHVSDSPRYKIEYQEADINDISIDDICNTVASEMEGANHHSYTGIAYFISKHMSKAGISDEDIKNVLWSMVKEKGFEWMVFKEGL